MADINSNSQDVRHQVEAEDGIRNLLTYIGEDLKREGILDTPKRVAKAYKEMTRGYKIDIDEILAKNFLTDNNEEVIMENIPFSSLCEHHMLPFFGTVTVRYKPNGKVVGLSKIPRVIEAYSKRLQIQEQLTQQIARALFEKIPNNQGVMVEIKARHMCVELRGIRSAGNITKTTSRYGIYKE